MIEKGWNMSSPYKWVVDCNAIAGVISSVMMFIGFKNMRLKYSPIINSIAASTFGVLLIHANSDAMRKWLWYDTLNNMAWCDTPYMVLHAIGSVATIFIICIAIDKIRIYALEKPTFKLIDKVLAKYGLK